MTSRLGHHRIANGELIQVSEVTVTMSRNNSVSDFSGKRAPGQMSRPGGELAVIDPLDDDFIESDGGNHQPTDRCAASGGTRDSTANEPCAFGGDVSFLGRPGCPRALPRQRRLRCAGDNEDKNGGADRSQGGAERSMSVASHAADA